MKTLLALLTYTVDLETGLPCDTRRKILPAKANPWRGTLDLNLVNPAQSEHESLETCLSYMFTSVVYNAP